jgi:hypothetical protein
MPGALKNPLKPARKTDFRGFL